MNEREERSSSLYMVAVIVKHACLLTYLAVT